MKKIIITAGFILLFIVATAIYVNRHGQNSNQTIIPSNSSDKIYVEYGKGTLTAICKDASVPGGQIDFELRTRKDDGSYHIVIASKPPQTDIPVTFSESESDYTITVTGDRFRWSFVPGKGQIELEYNGKAYTGCEVIG